MAYGCVAAVSAAVVILLATAGGGAAATSTVIYAFPGGTGTTGCTATSADCSLAAALTAAGTAAVTAPVTVTLEPPTSSSGPQVFYGNWNLTGATSADPITLNGNGQTLDGDQGAVTGTCETAACDGPVLTVTDAGTYVIEDVTIQNANNQTTFDGGALENDGGTVQVSGSTFTNDAAGADGGAIDNGDNGGDATLSVSNSTFTGDVAFGDGGAIDNGDGVAVNTTTLATVQSSGQVSVVDSTFADDTTNSADGGAIDNADNGGEGAMSVADSTFAGDSAEQVGDGGAIDNADNGGQGSLSVSASTFTADSAANQGDLIDNANYNGPSTDTGDGNVWVAGNVFADAQDAGCGTPAGSVNGSWQDDGYNLVGSTDPTCLGPAPASSDVSASPAGFALGGLADNGGPTQTIALGPGSAALGIIPAGTTVSLGPATLGTTTDQTVSLCTGVTDQRGDPRPGPCDAGAYESTTGPSSSTTTTTTTTTSTTSTTTPTAPSTTTTSTASTSSSDLHLTPVIKASQTVKVQLRTTVGHACTVPSLVRGSSLSKALAKLKSARCRIGSLYEVESIGSKSKLRTKLKAFRASSAQQRADTVVTVSARGGKHLAAGATLEILITQRS
jgi:hypothetical protein